MFAGPKPERRTARHNNPMDRNNLETRWRLLWNRLGAAAPPEGVYTRLIAAWNERHRRYHTLEHLRECLEWFDVVEPLAQTPALLELAIWFHDAVYQPGDENNELRSAYLAERALAAAGCSRDTAGDVRRMILATRLKGRPETADEKLLLDIDHSVLGADPLRFDRYDEGVRVEYAHIPGPAYIVARRQVLRGFHDRYRIYHTDYFYEQLEKQARVNLTRALKRLRPLHRLGV